MFLRALSICSPEYVDLEFKKIFDIGSSLKYPKFLIDTALRKARKTFYSLERTIVTRKNVLVLPFDLSFIDIPRILKCFNVHV